MLTSTPIKLKSETEKILYIIGQIIWNFPDFQWLLVADPFDIVMIIIIKKFNRKFYYEELFLFVKIRDSNQNPTEMMNETRGDVTTNGL